MYIRYGEPAHVSKRSDIRFETDAEVVRVKERTISYERTGTVSDEYNYLEIDPGESKPGRYEIAVAITDLNTGQTAEKTVTFFIGE